MDRNGAEIPLPLNEISSRVGLPLEELQRLEANGVSPGYLGHPDYRVYSLKGWQEVLRWVEVGA